MEPNQPLNPTPAPTTPVPDENGGIPPFGPSAATTPSIQAATPVPPSETPEPAASQRRMLFIGLAVVGALTLLVVIVVAFIAR